MNPAMRICFLCLTLIVQPCMRLDAGNIVLVRGTSSTPNDAEKAYAESLTRNLDNWLNELGLAHDTIDDEQVSSSTLSSAKVVILGYNPFPTPKELWALRTYIGKGGRLIVFYGADAKLAETFGLRLGGQLSAPRGGRFSQIKSAKDAPPAFPESVYQESRNIRPVYPVGNDAKVAAWWFNSTGESSGEPAVVGSSAGFWMSHVLLDDGDIDNKKQLLLVLVAQLFPAAWQPAAARSIKSACTIGPSSDFRNVMDAIASLAEANSTAPGVATSLSGATVIYNRILSATAASNYVDTVSGSRALRAVLVDAYARAQRPAKNEFRAVWDHSGTGIYPGDWNATCKSLAAAGFTDVFANMLGAGTAHYASRSFKRSEMFALYGDQIYQFVAAAHASGLKAHAWKVCWKFEGAPPEMLERMKKECRLQVTDSGQTLNWLCPSNPDNRSFELESITEMAANYKIDGIHLDYIRFKDGHACFCNGCRGRFEKTAGKKIANWPADVQSGELRKLYFQWRADTITTFVRDVANYARQLNPGIRISAAVFGKFQTCGESVGQNWPSWLKENHVDFVCPMDYTADLPKFESLVRSQMSLSSFSDRIFPGIGVTAMESRLDPVQVIDQIVTLRKCGARGFSIFDLSRGLEKEFLPLLRLGLTAE